MLLDTTSELRRIHPDRDGQRPDFEYNLPCLDERQTSQLVYTWQGRADGFPMIARLDLMVCHGKFGDASYYRD